mgnify:CR=1 FL=1
MTTKWKCEDEVISTLIIIVVIGLVAAGLASGMLQYLDSGRLDLLKQNFVFLFIVFLFLLAFSKL